MRIRSPRKSICACISSRERSTFFDSFAHKAHESLESRQLFSRNIRLRAIAIYNKNASLHFAIFILWIRAARYKRNRAIRAQTGTLTSRDRSWGSRRSFRAVKVRSAEGGRVPGDQTTAIPFRRENVNIFRGD